MIETSANLTIPGQGLVLRLSQAHQITCVDVPACDGHGTIRAAPIPRYQAGIPYSSRLGEKRENPLRKLKFECIPDEMDQASSSTTPTDLKLRLSEQCLVVTWADGAVSELQAPLLRQSCPCASCRTERSKEDQNRSPLRILKADPGKIRLNSAELVGRYAIRLVWSDGHDSGIYDFRYLRSLVPG